MGIQPTDLRKMRKGQILQHIETSGGIEMKKLLGIFSLRTGLTTATVLKMVNELVDAEVITINEGIVRTTKRAEVEAKELEKDQEKQKS